MRNEIKELAVLSEIAGNARRYMMGDVVNDINVAQDDFDYAGMLLDSLPQCFRDDDDDVAYVVADS